MIWRILAVAVAVALRTEVVQAESAEPLNIGSEPQLLVDDWVVERSEGLTRTLHHPVRVGEPVLDNARFGTTQPYLTVLYDAATKRYRAWYNRPGELWHADSADGVRWENPRKLNLPVRYCCAVVDDGDREPDPSRRYKVLYWFEESSRPRGIYAAFSPDGLDWTPHADNPVILGYSDDPAKIVKHHVGDIIDTFYDPVSKRHMAALKVPAVAEDKWAEAPRAGGLYRRLVGMTFSEDYLHWSRPFRIFVPDEKDEGLLEFYGMGGIHRRGQLLIGFVRVLRDDLPCDEGGPKDGIGYTVLASSRDGQTWHRWREPFLDRNRQAGSWDHAMTWMGFVLPMGDEVYLYYGGYKHGHKVEAGRERQIGLAKIRKDGYVSLSAGDKGGGMLTRPVTFAGGKLALNVAVAAGGAIRVEIQDEGGRPVSGFAMADCEPIAGDAISALVKWRGKTDVSALAGKAVRVRFELRSAELYAFQFGK